MSERQEQGASLRDGIPYAFCPDSYDGKPRWLPKDEKLALQELLAKIDAHVAWIGESEADRLLSACLHISPINCAWDEYGMAKLVIWRLERRFAQAIEAGTAETGTGSVHESAVAESHAPDPHPASGSKG